MSAVDYTIQLIVEAKNKATAELNKIWENVDRIKSKTLQLSESTKKSLQQAGIVATAVATSVIAVWKKAVESATQMEPIQNSFQRLSKDVWIASDDMLKAMRKASKGTVSDFKLMSSANKAYTLWVIDNIDDMTVLLEWARLKWQAMWETMEEAMNDIVTWLWRWSVQILDNLWIVIKQEEAYERYAEMLGKTTKELTAQEKEQALQKVTMEELRKELEKAGDVQLTMWERLQIVNAQWENMKVKIWEALVPILEELLKKAQPILDKIADFIENNPETIRNIVETTLKIAWLVAWISWFILLAPKVQSAIALMTSPLWEFWIALWVVHWLLSKLEQSIISTDEQIALYRWEIALLDEQLQAGVISQDEYNQKLDEYNLKITEAQEKSMSLWQYLKDWLNEVLRDMTHIVQSSKEAFQAFWVIVNAVWDFFGRLAETIGTFFVNAVQKAKEKIDWLVESLRQAFKRAQKVGADVWWAVSNAFNSVKSRVTWRAVWWPVYAWQEYLVWENWPEMFVPSQNGRIVRNEDLGQTWNTSININFGDVSINDWTDQQSLAETIASTITRQLELYKKGIY